MVFKTLGPTSVLLLSTVGLGPLVGVSSLEVTECPARDDLQSTTCLGEWVADRKPISFWARTPSGSLVQVSQVVRPQPESCRACHLAMQRRWRGHDQGGPACSVRREAPVAVGWMELPRPSPACPQTPGFGPSVTVHPYPRRTPGQNLTTCLRSQRVSLSLDLNPISCHGALGSFPKAWCFSFFSTGD